MIAMPVTASGLSAGVIRLGKLTEMWVMTRAEARGLRAEDFGQLDAEMF